MFITFTGHLADRSRDDKSRSAPDAPLGAPISTMIRSAL
jgi:hypothetical protein